MTKCMPRTSSAIPWLLVLLIGLAGLASGQTWEQVTPGPAGISTSLLLTDGTVMAHVSNSNQWYRLTPDRSGSYVHGTWSAMPSMRDTRLYYASVVLRDGRVLVGGGEYGTGGSTVEIYDPVANSWTVVSSWTGGDIGDSTAVVMDDGRVLLLPRLASNGQIWDPLTDTWTPVPAKPYGRNDEESVIHLSDGTFLIASVNGTSRAQRYLPATNQWIDAGLVPVNLVDSGYEVGAGVLLYDGRVLVLGATGNTAIYSSGNPGAWIAGPILPNGFKADDAPATVMPNGSVLLTADQGLFAAPTRMFEFNPATNIFMPVPTPFGTDSDPCYTGRMLRTQT